MNLPASAVEFLDVFRNLYPSSVASKMKMPLIHCYTFIKAEKGEDYVAKAKQSVEQVLQLSAQDIEYEEVFDVRDVSPKKFMLCVSFRLPECVAFQVKRKLEAETEMENPEKKSKHSCPE